jgi:hypothetical protein
MKKYSLILIIIFGFNVGEMGAKDYAQVYGQSQMGKRLSLPEKGRDPFGLPPGIKLLSPTGEEKQIKKEEKKEDLSKLAETDFVSDQRPEGEPSAPTLVLKAILISDRIRLAAIGERLVTEGAVIGEERVLEIRPDRVILGQGPKKRILYLPQSPVPLIVEER